MQQRHSYILALTLLVVLAAARVSAYENLHLRLVPKLEYREELLLDMGQRLARVDSLEAGWDDLSDEEIAARKVEVAKLYASSSLTKHRVWATEDISDRKMVPTLSAYCIKAAAYDAMGNKWAARRTYEDMIEAYPDSARAHREAARATLEIALYNFDERGFERSLKHFRRAVRCPDTTVEDWIGLASALLANQDYAALKNVGDRLLEMDGPSPGSELYAAVGYHAEGMGAEADRLFRAAAKSMDPVARKWFFGAEEFFQSYRPSFIDNALMPEVTPPAMALWWTRIVEIEVLFGKPRSDVHGWETNPGRLYLRYGRPRLLVYFMPGDVPTLDEFGALHGLDHIRQALNSEVGDSKFRGPAHWLWVYNFFGQDVPFFFEGGGGLFGWASTEVSGKRIEAVVEAIPVTLVPPQREHDLDLDVRHAAFRTVDDRVRAEAYFAIDRNQKLGDIGPEDIFRIRITVLDENGTAIDKVERHLDGSYQRNMLLDAIGLRPGNDRTVIGQLAVELPPATYTLRLEVEDLETGAYQGHDREFILKNQERLLDLSDIQLCDAFVDYDERMNLPDGFLKHARVVIPHPEDEVRGRDDIYLYYEVYGAELDERGETHLDVIYEIFPARGFSPTDAGRPVRVPGAVEPLTRLVFVDERTGLSPRGIVVKGTRLDVSELPPGHYVVSVALTDRLGRDEAQRYLEVRTLATSASRI